MPRSKRERAAIDRLDRVEADERSTRHALSLHRAQRTADEWRRHALALEKALDLETRRCDALLAIKEPIEIVSIRPSKSRTRKNLTIAGAIASDWHVGETVTRGQTAGRNEYSPKTCEERAARFFERALRLVEIQRGGAEIRDFVLCLLGDFIGGYIHEDLKLTNAMSPTEEVRFAKRLLIAGIDFLLQRGKFSRLHIPCSYGNHGRTNPGKPLVGAAPRNSYEVMLYADLADHYRHDQRVSVYIPEGAFVYLDLSRYILRCTHGDTFRYQGGIGGLTIPLVKALHRWETQRRADLTLFGHWHTYSPGPRWIGNGSLKGFDAWASFIGVEYEPPQQAFFAIDVERRRRTAAEPIFVE
jgi:hypothetical protein